VIEFSFLMTAISLGVGTAITLIGIPVLIGTVYAWRWMAQIERGLIGSLTGVRIPSPYRAIPADVGWSRKLGLRLADPATWKDLVFLMLQLPLGIASFTIAVVVVGLAAAFLGAPAYYWSVSDGIDVGFWQIDTLAGALALVPLGLLVAIVGIPALGVLGRLYGTLGSLLLGSNTDPELTAQMTDLQGARSRIIAAADAERRRIERDLHDGAQQRLVALALQLRMAESRAADGDPEAAALIRGAGEEANLALKELRDLARGIHPAILTNRGLGAALDDLAARATLPTKVVECPRERLPDEVEAAAYFVVSEALANVGKHAGAESATVAARVDGGQLVVEVADDGTGGAVLGSGSGLQGLEDRVGALDGSMRLHSPPGEGTRLEATIPLSAELDVPELDVFSTPVVLPDDEAATVAAGRTRRMRMRVGALSLVGLLLVLIWGLTGMTGTPPWFYWPLLGLGLVGGIDAWVAIAGRPLRESDLGPGSPRPEEIRRARKARSLRLDAGVLGVLNLILIGIWLPSAPGYFWPIWPIVGCAAAVAIKAYGWPARDASTPIASGGPGA
jgi:signal transduction histidine kinase